MIVIVIVVGVADDDVVGFTDVTVAVDVAATAASVVAVVLAVVIVLPLELSKRTTWAPCANMSNNVTHSGHSSTVEKA